MAIVAGLFAGLFGRLLGRRKGAVVAVIAIAFYTVLVGANAAVVRSLLEADLLDELTLLIHPVIVGSCKRLFKDNRALKRMQLVNSKITGSGVAILTYQPRRNALFRFGMSPGVGG